MRSVKLYTTFCALVITVGAFTNDVSATAVGGEVTFLSSGTGSYTKLFPGFTESTPDNTVGENNFQNNNLYVFDEDQNINLTEALAVDILSTGGSGSLSIGTEVASHYVFFDPNGSVTQKGYVDFDAPILAIITSTGLLDDSDFLANTGVTYESPTLRGLESVDDVWINSSYNYRLNVDWTASNPGDYVRVLTDHSSGAEVPEPSSILLLSTGLLALRVYRRSSRSA